MKQPPQIAFLVALVRVVAIYWAFNALDGVAYTGSYLVHAERPVQIWTSAFVLFPVLLSVIAWKMAPRICRWSVGGQTFDETEPAAMTPWNATLIFLAGVFCVAWGLNRIANDFLQQMKLHEEAFTRTAFTPRNLHFYISFVYIGTGVLLMRQCGRIQRWIERR